MDASEGNQKGLAHIIIRLSYGNYVKLKIMDIKYIEVNHMYSTLFIRDGKKYVVRKSLREWQDTLKEPLFVRINRQYLINMKYVERIKESVYLLDKKQIQIPHGKVKKIRFLYEQYLKTK